MRSVIETERLLLRKMKYGDLDDLCHIYCDKESMQYYPMPFTREKVKSWIEWNTRNYSSYGFGLWVVIRKREGIFLGDCGITMQNIEGEELPELGFHILTDHRQNGYATEAAEACIDYAFKSLELNTLYSYTSRENIPSQRVNEKIGMSFVREFRKSIMGKDRDERLYAIHRRREDKNE